MLFTQARCRHIMERALRTPFRVECGPDIKYVAQRFYRTRQSCQNQGNLRFDGPSPGAGMRDAAVRRSGPNAIAAMPTRSAVARAAAFAKPTGPRPVNVASS